MSDNIYLSLKNQYSETRIKYIPIILDTLALDSILNFDLYYKSGPQFIFYKSKNLKLNEEQFNYMKQHFKALFIKTTEQKEYLHYVENNIDFFLSNSEVSDNIKAFVLYDISQEVITEIFEKPDDPKSAERAKNIIKATTMKLTNDDSFFFKLLDAMSFDYSTYTHSINVSTFSLNFSKSLQINDMKLLESIGVGAFLHDIGKSQIPQEILFKKGKLYKDEFLIVSLHTNLGYDLIKKEFPDNWVIQKIVRHHHEKLDGSGYPDGLVADEIPLEVQIVTLSDIFDALTTSRCYKKKVKTYDALTIMRNEQMSGKYNKELLDKFIKMFGKYRT